jgi:hypothetical protein
VRRGGQRRVPPGRLLRRRRRHRRVSHARPPSFSSDRCSGREDSCLHFPSAIYLTDSGPKCFVILW